MQKPNGWLRHPLLKNVHQPPQPGSFTGVTFDHLDPTGPTAKQAGRYLRVVEGLFCPPVAHAVGMQAGMLCLINRIRHARC